MKRLIAGFVLGFAAVTCHAETVGPGCAFAWDYVQPLPADVDGFRFYLDGTHTWTGTTLEAACADAGVTVPGTHSAYVVAFNDVGESGQSNVLTFTYVTGAPIDAPTMLRFQP